MPIGKFGKELARAIGRRSAFDMKKAGRYAFADLPKTNNETIDRYIYDGARQVSDEAPLTWFSTDLHQIEKYLYPRLERRSDAALRDAWTDLYYRGEKPQDKFK